jgi:carbon monoxide dehydrogenase subunit G
MNLSFRLNKTVDFIFDYLTDMQKFVTVHPIIYQIDKINQDEYLVHETLKFGFMPFSFTYPVYIESNVIEKTVLMKATVMKLTKIEIKFVLKTDNNFTMIEENIQIVSLLPIKSLVESIFRKQHTQLFKNIELVIA